MGQATTRPSRTMSGPRRASAGDTAGAADVEDTRLGEDHADDGRSARKRRAIIAAATTLFLQQGYQETSMDQIAALARVSKQTVYKHFADKERLFSAITLGVTQTAEDFIRAVPRLLGDVDDLEQGLRSLARRYIAAVMQPQVLQLRHLVIAEAGRFPELARTYYERAPGLVLATLASGLRDLATRGLLRLEDPLLAASHFAYLIVGPPLDQALFYGGESFSAAELERVADAGVRVFLAAYGAPTRIP